MTSPTFAMRASKWLGIVFCLTLLLPVAFFAVRFVQGVPYLYCLGQEASWLAAKDEGDLDGRMKVFHTKRTITPSESSWGRWHELQPGQRMVRYLIFGLEPLDAVFDRDSRVVVIYTTYE